MPTWPGWPAHHHVSGRGHTPSRASAKQPSRLFARGVPPAVVARRIAGAEFGHAQPPTNRTIARWHTDRRWLTTGTAAALPL